MAGDISRSFKGATHCTDSECRWLWPWPALTSTGHLLCTRHQVNPFTGPHLISPHPGPAITEEKLRFREKGLAQGHWLVGAEPGFEHPPPLLSGLCLIAVPTLGSQVLAPLSQTHSENVCSARVVMGGPVPTSPALRRMEKYTGGQFPP